MNDVFVELPVSMEVAEVFMDELEGTMLSTDTSCTDSVKELALVEIDRTVATAVRLLSEVGDWMDSETFESLKIGEG